jgi:AraC-like DNA-binding protein
VQESSAAVEAAFVLAEGAWNTPDGPSLEPPSEARRTLRRMAMSTIDAHLGQREMTPASIAAGLGISRSTLYALFEPEGGIESYVFARRLDRSFEAIVNDPARVAGIGEIAFAHGFKSEAHFSRAFLARFGVKPSEVRRLVTAGGEQSSAQGDDGSAAMTLADWVRRLGRENPEP